MNALTKLAVAALSAAGIAGGVAVAQTAAPNPTGVDGRQDTANYGTPPGAPLKRDGSLQGDAIQPAAPMAADSTSTMTTTTTDTTTTPAAPVADTSSTVVAPAADTAAQDTSSDAMPQPRTDRN